VENHDFVEDFDSEVFEKLKALAMTQLPGKHESEAELLDRSFSFK